MSTGTVYYAQTGFTVQLETTQSQYSCIDELEEKHNSAEYWVITWAYCIETEFETVLDMKAYWNSWTTKLYFTVFFKRKIVAQLYF